jgi:hypothetical protein
MFIIDDDVVTIEEKEYFKNEIVHNGSFPVFHSRVFGELSKYDMFTHTLLLRGINKDNVPFEQTINSPHFHVFYNIFTRFCNNHNIKINEIFRSCINVTFSIQDLEKFDAHVDHDFNHNIFLLYLNDLPYSDQNNSTIVYEQKFEDFGLGLIQNKQVELAKNLTVEKEVYPKAGRCLFFPGNFHAIKNPLPDYLRYVCVFTFK